MKLDLTNFAPLVERLMELAPLTLAAQLRHTFFDVGFRAKVARFLADNPDCLDKPLERMSWRERLVRLHSIIAVAGDDAVVKEAAANKRALDVISADPAAFKAYLGEKLAEARGALGGLEELSSEERVDRDRLAELMRGVRNVLGEDVEVIGDG